MGFWTIDCWMPSLMHFLLFDINEDTIFKFTHHFCRQVMRNLQNFQNFWLLRRSYKLTTKKCSQIIQKTTTLGLTIYRIMYNLVTLSHFPTFRRQQKKSARAKKIVRLCSMIGMLFLKIFPCTIPKNIYFRHVIWFRNSIDN